MSLSLSYGVAANNIDQLLQYEKDNNHSEGRLGVWRFGHSIYYVSSTDCKIAKLWFDFLRFIGLIIDSRDPKFGSIKDVSSNTFNKLYFGFNKNTPSPEQLSELNKTNSDYTKQIYNLSVEITEKKNRIIDLEKEISDLKKKSISSSKNDKESKKSLESQKTKYEAEIKALNEKLEEAKKQLSIKSTATKVSSDKEDNSIPSTNLSKIRNELLKEKREHHHLQKEHQSKIEALESENQKLTQELIALKAGSKSHSTSDGDKVVSLEVQMKSLESLVKEKGEENLNLHAQIDELKRKENSHAPEISGEKSPRSGKDPKEKSSVKRLFSLPKKLKEKEKSTDKIEVPVISLTATTTAAVSPESKTSDTKSVHVDETKNTESKSS